MTIGEKLYKGNEYTMKNLLSSLNIDYEKHSTMFGWNWSFHFQGYDWYAYLGERRGYVSVKFTARNPEHCYYDKEWGNDWTTEWLGDDYFTEAEKELVDYLAIIAFDNPEIPERKEASMN